MALNRVFKESKLVAEGAAKDQTVQTRRRASKAPPRKRKPSARQADALWRKVGLAMGVEEV